MEIIQAENVCFLPQRPLAPILGCGISVNPCDKEITKAPHNPILNTELSPVPGYSSKRQDADPGWFPGKYSFPLLEMGIGIACTGSGKDNHRPHPDFHTARAFPEAARTPETSTAPPSLSSFKEKSALPGSYTHCTQPSLFRRTTKAIVPISRMAWTAHSPLPPLPPSPGKRRSPIFQYLFLLHSCQNSITLVSPFSVAGL